MITIPKFNDQTETEITLPKLMRTKDVCKYFNIHRTTLYNWTKSQILQTIRVGNSQFYKVEDIKTLVENI